MNKIWLIAKREYLTRLLNKWFLALTILMPIGIALIYGISIFFLLFSNTEQKIVVVDETGQIGSLLKDEDKLKLENSEESLTKLKENLNYKDKGFAGILYIPSNVLDTDSTNSKITYYSESPLGTINEATLSEDLNTTIRQIKLEKKGLNLEEIKSLDKIPSLTTSIVDESGDKSSNSGLATGLSFFMGILIYITIFIYGAMVMQGVVEEKSNRIVEVIVSSVRPFQLLLGKILGIGMVGLTQFGLWVILGIGGTSLVGYFLRDNLAKLGDQASSNASGIDIASLTNTVNIPLTIFLFFVYFIGGYLLYSALMASLASCANTERDAQTLNTPVYLVVVAAYLIGINVSQNPTSQIASFASIFPFTSPIVMLARIPFGVPWWEILISIVLLYATFLGTTWVASKIYRVGILMYGKKPNLLEILKWLRY